MVTSQDIESALRRVVPPEYEYQIPVLASILAHAATSNTTQHSRIPSSPALDQLLTALAGKQVATSEALLTFGTGNQLGDIRIRDIAGGNITNVSLHIHNHNITIPNRTYQRRKSRSRRPIQTTVSTATSTNPVLRSVNKLTSTDLPRTVFVCFRIGIFSVIGFMFGWYAIINATNTQYLYQEGNEFSLFRLMGAIVFALIGTLIGFSFLSRKKRASGIAWWLHPIGILATGAFLSPSMEETMIGSFWIGGVLMWFVFWFLILGGYKEFR